MSATDEAVVLVLAAPLLAYVAVLALLGAYTLAVRLRDHLGARAYRRGPGSPPTAREAAALTAARAAGTVPVATPKEPRP